jgi:hypothetical protein
MGPTDTAFDRGSFATLEKIAATLGMMDEHLGLIRDASMISFMALLAKQSKGDMVWDDVDDMMENSRCLLLCIYCFLESSIDFGDVDRWFDTKEQSFYFKILYCDRVARDIETYIRYGHVNSVCEKDL